MTCPYAHPGIILQTTIDGDHKNRITSAYMLLSSGTNVERFTGRIQAIKADTS